MTAQRPIDSVSLGQLTHGEPWRLAMTHDRDHHLLLWITRGQGRITINGLRRGIGMHNAIFLPAGTLMAAELGAQVFGQALLIAPGAAPALPDRPHHLRIRDGLAQAELTAQIEAMQREIQQGRPLLAEALAAHASLVGVWLHRQLAAGAVDAPPDSAARRLVRRFAQMVAQDYRTGLSMADFATRLEVTPTHLSRVCRQCADRTASDLLTERRLHAAREMLSRPDGQIKDIAAGLGFHSAAYFTRFVQQHTGATPSELRRKAVPRM